MARILEGNAEEACDELAHALVDLGEQVAFGGIERVVEVEHPGVDMRKAAVRHGIAKRSVLPPPLATSASPLATEPFGT